jgi:hypothetical protein
MNHFTSCFSFIFLETTYLLSLYKRTKKVYLLVPVPTVVNKSMGEGILKMRVCFPSLKVLRLQGSRVTADQLVALRAAMPNCHIKL